MKVKLGHSFTIPANLGGKGITEIPDGAVITNIRQTSGAGGYIACWYLELKEDEREEEGESSGSGERSN